MWMSKFNQQLKVNVSPVLTRGHSVEDVSVCHLHAPINISLMREMFHKQTLNYSDLWQQTKPKHWHMQLFGGKRFLQKMTKCIHHEKRLIVPCTKVFLMQFAVNTTTHTHTHTHLETLCLMKFSVWLPISYLLNSKLTICSGCNLLNAESWERKWDSASWPRDTKSFRALTVWLLWLTGGLVVANSIHHDCSYHHWGTLWDSLSITLLFREHRVGTFSWVRPESSFQVKFVDNDDTAKVGVTFLTNNISIKG